MQVISIYDLSFNEAAQAFERMRYKAGRPPVSDKTMKSILDYTGGRLSYLNRVAREKDPISMAEHIMSTEKSWLLGQIGLIPDCDDDVMDEVSLCWVPHRLFTDDLLPLFAVAKMEQL